MQLTKQLEAEVLKVYNEYWECYITGNVESMSALLADEYTQIGSAASEVFFSKKEAVKFLYKTIYQVAGKSKMQNRRIQVEPLGKIILVHDIFDVYVLTENQWAFYAQLRASTLMEEKNDGWKFIHQHSSFPDARTDEGENLAIDKIAEENRQLREAVKRRTVELEEKNRELEIEAALEKVRSRSLAMHKSEELQEVANTLFERLKELDVKVDSANIVLFQEGKRDFDFWVASPYQKGMQSFHIAYSDLLITKDLVAARESGTAFFEKSYTFEEKNEWFNYAFTNTSFKFLSEERKQMILTAKAVTLSIAFSTNTGIQVTRYSTQLLTEEQAEILKKFSKVFEQAYIRFLDLQKAEAQTREAQIEASLEKVRAKAMAMRNTQDLADTIGVFYQELHSYSMTPIRCGVGLLNKDSKIAELFTWNTTDKGQSLELVGNLKMEGHPVLENVYHNWINEKEYHPVLRGNEIKHYYEILRPQIAFPNYDDDVIQYGYFFFFKEGGVYAWMSKKMTEDELNIYRRFTSVLSLTYKRHKDLQLAEAHALKAEQDLIVIKEARQKAEIALLELQATQKQLIQSEKMASLGELTAGIAHEIQNPLNFVNNFSELNTELIEELLSEIARGNVEEMEALAKSIKENEEKINYHGKRADGIVKGMLQHSRSNPGQKELTDINQLVEEYLRLSYHGLRAKNSLFNATIQTRFDNTIGKMNVVPQDIGRVLLNLLTNAFYAVNEKAKKNIDQFEPTVFVSTEKVEDKIIISVRDNGNGISESILNKIFQPFFTTKPTGEGTGLGLSLSYDIVKAHGGELKVKTKENEFTEFILHLPSDTLYL